MVSHISGPIPPHPRYDTGDTKLYLNLPAPRVRPEAQDIASQGQGTVSMLLQVEGHSAFSAGRKTKAEPKDHVKENVRRMRQIQRASREKDEEKQAPVKALWKSTKYEEVSSKVRDELSRAPHNPRPHSANYLRAHSRTGWAPQSARPASVEPPVEKLTVPRSHTAREVRLQRHDIDFVKLNGMTAKRIPMRRSPSLTQLDDLKKKHADDISQYQRGEVPKYLQKRKTEWKQEEEERVASIPDPDMPEGHRLMGHEERTQTLGKLRATQTDLLQQLNSMPIRTDTMRMRSRKEELEKKLVEIEEAIKIFSRPKVFVRLDA